MTVCIAAACETSQIMVTASDRLVTWGHTSAEAVLQAVRLHYPNWLAMIAGNDITVGVEAVTTSVRDTMAALGEPPSAVQMRRVLLGAWREIQNERAESLVLGPYGLSLKEFRNHGLKQFGEAKFYELSSRIEQASHLQCDLLAVGFHDEGRVPGLLVCGDDIGCVDFSRAGFAAIGSGHTEALASLAFHEYDTLCSLKESIYRVCAAKFMAEKAIGVGKATIVMCLRNDGRMLWMFKRHIDAIGDLWEAEGRPRVPGENQIAKAVDPILADQKWLDD